jgi:hypothetical protein
MARKHRKVAETSAVQPSINTKEETIKHKRRNYKKYRGQGK